ncbi:PREDICTED: LIM/homeobox protein Lhx9-like isoform X2 [Trachymyrmex septentrionalis]|uniref:LIM/homeobox protein Lhx9-like isoform X2 n=1 Tax=Trachymyrmex septentrionalis TaxID=34720 RepID=UPI00084F3DE4|nr:PREDICTED: LIM/homeobox protein Lhx9-like isoform X2 [Trachymyrmex septentrionalis]
MNPHHPGHSAAYPHHPSLSSSPHHPGPGGPHHAYGTGGGGGGGGGGGTTTTPDLPSPHSPQHSGGAGDPATPYGALQPGQGMGSNGHHHSGGGMMPDHPHHPGHPHPHMPGHPAYPPVNHNNNCTLKQEGVPSGSTGLRQCAACGVQIVERWLLLAMDRYWHIGCLKCTYCNVVLGEIGQSCYTKSGMILCKADYRRMFGSSGVCGSCGNAIPANEMVMRAGDSVFHVKCFNCNKCGGQLVSGDRYYLLSGSPICESDWHKIVKSSSVAAAAAAAGGNSGTPVRKGGNPVGRPKKVQPSPQPTPPVVPSPQVDVVDVAVGVDPYSPPPPGHQHYHQYHHHHHHQMALVHPGLAAQQSHLQASSYQDWSSWAQDTCD